MVLKEIITVDELFRTEPQFFPDKVKFCLDRETGVVAVCRELGTGTGRLLTDDALKDELLDLLKKWIR
ncbi:MAG: hypothetical protein IK016_11820 [Lachnospiraceae bacterium]|nr:hypothetical protein [Lachnospiraceae bacterium]